MYNLFANIVVSLPLEWFARAGGGGSGGGGGGGDGEGGILFIIGYLPMHAVGAVFRKISQDNIALKVIFNIAGWIIAIIYALVFMSSQTVFGFFVGLFALLGMGAGLYGWFNKIKQSAFTKKKLDEASAKDSAWNEERLVEYAKKVFSRYQNDWSKLDTDTMASYMTPNYHNHAMLLAYTLKSLKRHNYVYDINISEAIVTDVNDSDDDSQDSFVIGFTASANDKLVEDISEQVLYQTNDEFVEYWTFRRNGNSWLLDQIYQATANLGEQEQSIQQLAQQNGYYYSLDMGYLFIPKQGQLFGGAQFGASDINNHVVGLYKEQMLVQLYTYRKTVQDSNNFVIAQVSVPRQYGNIVVRRKKNMRFGGIKGLDKIETEWTQFNDKYEVYASSHEGATSFELLNPTYMEMLEALNFEVNIEVVDNIIYLYTSLDAKVLSATSGSIYNQMLDILNKAFAELKL